MRSNYRFRHYQERIDRIKEFIQMKEQAEGRPVTDEDFKDCEAPCDSMPEIVHKDGHTYWRLDGDLYIDRTDEKLIPKETTFNELVKLLSANPEVAANAEVEKEIQADEQREAELREKFGDEYEIVFEKKMKKDKLHRPGARVLRCIAPHIAVIECQNAKLEVFDNGYAVYDNGNRQVVMWVPDCGSTTYYFTALRKDGRGYPTQKSEIGIDILGELPWYHALVIAGEDRIELSMDHPKSVGSTSEFDLESLSVKPASHWVGACHFDTPEVALMKKEAAEERKKALTEKQNEICELHYENGMSMRKIAEHYGVDFTTIREQVASIKRQLKEDPEKYFSDL